MQNLKNKRLLFLEDSVEYAQNMISLFEMFVGCVVHVETISEAFAAMDERKVDIVISDIQLRNENGLEFVKELRAKNQKIPIIILSGQKDEEFLFRAIPLNLVGYLVKPIKYAQLTEVLEECAKKLEQNDERLVQLKGDFYFDNQQKNIVKDDEIFSLNKKEILFFELLVNNKEKIITKDMLIACVWEYEEASDAAINNFILRIRRRFGKDFIYTIPEVGYRLIS